jgi:hypothetical protein
MSGNVSRDTKEEGREEKRSGNVNRCTEVRERRV